MAFSKIILNNTTLMDATTATAAAADITAPKTAMLADGVMTTGTGSGGGGGGPTTVASGTYTGTGGYPSTAGTGFFVGTKMPQTDFWVKFAAQSDSEYTYDTDYKHAYGLAVIFSDIGHFDLSSVADSIQITSDKSYNVNNSGTVTAVAAGVPIVFMDNVRNSNGKNTNAPNNCRIDRRSDGFYFRFYNSNSAYKYVSGMKYDWEVVYFGSSPSTDIIEVS